MPSGRFAMAVHALALLSQSEDGYPSARVAESVNTHAVFLRRLLGRLAEAGLIEAREGRGGGYRLHRPAERITLADVYRAIEPEGPLSPSPAEPSGRDPIGAGMRGTFDALAARVRNGVLTELGEETVAGVARSAAARGRRRG